MGLQTEMSLHDDILDLSKEDALKIHLQSNFYPPHPSYVVESTIEGFNKYWKDEIELDKLAEACYLRNIDGLYQYYSTFLKE